MGMLLVMGLVLAIASAIIEFRVLKAIPLFGKWNKKSAAFGMALSFAISWIFGWLFAASGLVVMFAGVLSSALTEPVHMVKRAREGAGNKLDDTVMKIEEILKPWIKLGKICLFILFIPIAAPWWCIKQYNLFVDRRPRYGLVGALKMVGH